MVGQNQQAKCCHKTYGLINGGMYGLAALWHRGPAVKRHQPTSATPRGSFSELLPPSERLCDEVCVCVCLCYAIRLCMRVCGCGGNSTSNGHCFGEIFCVVGVHAARRDRLTFGRDPDPYKGLIGINGLQNAGSRRTDKILLANF